MTKAVVLAGGRGTRLTPYTFILPKPLLPVGDLPILEILLRRLKMAGIDNFTFCVGYKHELVRAFFGDGARWDVQIEYSVENEPLGTAGPLSLIAGLDETFLVANGDLLTDISFSDLLAFHKKHQAVATVGAIRQKVKIDLGVIELDDQQQLMKYVEKPSLHYLASIGLYVFEPAVLSYIPRDQFLNLPDLMNSLRRDNQPVRGYIHKGYWLDIGRMADYQQALNDLPDIQQRLLPED
ncbi:MAG: NTP transferase domain-containing protein [Anaerolineae bacterium]|nr:NTP transferase domain-containing protein [Anaerolineae bacterium]